MANTKFVEWEKRYTWGVAIEVTPNKVINLLLRDENNLLHVNGDNELYCDLQIANWIAPDDAFEVWVTTGMVNEADGRPQSWLLLHYEEAGGAYAQWLKGNDGKIYLDPGTGTFKLVYYADDVDALFTQLRSEISAVWYSGEYDDLLNRPGVVHISYSEEQQEWIVEWDLKDNATVMITPFEWQVPASITIDWDLYTVLGTGWVPINVYGAEPLCWIYQIDHEDNDKNYIVTFLRKPDTALNATSTNAVENQVVKAWLDLKANIADISAVWFSWEYNDLLHKPTIGDATLTIKRNWVVEDTFTANATQNVMVDIDVPTKISDLTDDSDFVEASELADVAFTGNYNNLTNTPTIWDATFIVQKNGVEVWRTTANATSASVANVLVPNVIDNLTSTSTGDSLSANQGKVLYEKVLNLEARGRFLSGWNCATWLPLTNPVEDPYPYKAWDYYLVSVIASAWGTNYKPNGSSYVRWVASTTVDSNLDLEVWDTYIYDGTTWVWQRNTQRTVSFPNIAGDAMDNVSLAWYFNAKQDTILAGTNITINADGKTINAVMPSLNDASTVTKGIVKIASDSVQTESANAVTTTADRTYAVQYNSNGQLVVNVPWTDTQPTTVSDATSTTKWILKLWSDTVQSVAPENVSSTNNRTYALQVNGSWQWVVNVPWTDTTYTAGTNVSIDSNNEISVNIPAYSTATSSTAWVVKLASDTVQGTAMSSISSTTGRTYWVQLNANNQMVVNVPWTDTQPTTYSEWNGIDITNNTISVDVWDLDGTWLTTSNNQLAIDTTVVATQTDLSWKANASDLNVKAFTITWYTGQSNLDEATAAYEWFDAGKVPILYYSNRAFNLYARNPATWELRFETNYIAEADLYQHILTITIVSWEATSIALTTVHHSMVSSQPNNVLNDWVKLRAWTQANYESLSSYDSNTIYLTL